ncbi:MAG: ATP-binding protein [Bacillota bacterium]|nr:ATP-binding protein [Bacillota bacterium]
MNQRAKDPEDHRVDDRLRALTHPNLLILDGFGYVPIERPVRRLLLPAGEPALRAGQHHPDEQFVVRGVGHGVGNDVLAAVIVDRFLRYRTIIAIRDRSCRLKENGRARAFRLPEA